MARLIGPDDRTFTISGLPGTALRNIGGYTATAYAASTGSTLANIINLDNTPISGSVLTFGDDSRLPLFQFPDGVDTVWLEVTEVTGRFPVYARVDDRLDAIKATADAAVPRTGNIGFYGSTPISKPTVSGSRGGNAAVASLLAQLVALGLITDVTTI